MISGKSCGFTSIDRKLIKKSFRAGWYKQLSFRAGWYEQLSFIRLNFDGITTLILALVVLYTIKGNGQPMSWILL